MTVRWWRWWLGAALLIGACGGGTEEASDATGADDAPAVSIGAVSTTDEASAFIEYSIDDVGPLRVTIDWGDGTALQGFTGGRGTFTGQHRYDAAATAAIVTIAVTDIDGNTTSASSSIDLAASRTTVGTSASSTSSPAVAATTRAPSTIAPPATTAPATTAAPPAPTTTTTPTTTSTTTITTTTTTTTTTTQPPVRSIRLTVTGRDIRVTGDCDTIGGAGDFVIRARLRASAGDPAEISLGTPLNPDQINVGERRIIANSRSVSQPLREGVRGGFEAELLVAEVDVAGLDPDMDERFTSDPDTVVMEPGVRLERQVSVGSGDCRVEMNYVVTTELAG